MRAFGHPGFIWAHFKHMDPLSRARQLHPKAKKGSRDSRDLFLRISTAGMQTLLSPQLSTCQPERSKTGSWATAKVCPGSVSSWIVPLTSLVPLTYASCDLRDDPDGFPQTILLRFIVSRPQDMGAIGAARGIAFIAQSPPSPSGAHWTCHRHHKYIRWSSCSDRV